MEVDRLYTCCFLVIDFQILWNYRNIKNRVFQITRKRKEKKKTKKKKKKKKRKRKNQNYSKPPRLVRQLLFKKFQQKPNIFLVFH